jgi:hypothetical protein
LFVRSLRIVHLAVALMRLLLVFVARTDLSLDILFYLVNHLLFFPAVYVMHLQDGVTPWRETQFNQVDVANRYASAGLNFPPFIMFWSLACTSQCVLSGHTMHTVTVQSSPTLGFLSGDGALDVLSGDGAVDFLSGDRCCRRPPLLNCSDRWVRSSIAAARRPAKRFTHTSKAR